MSDPTRYETYFDADGAHRKNALIDSAIFPNALPPSAVVERFDYHYYDPWDPNFTNILVFTCDPFDREAERERLRGIPSTKFCYGATDFPFALCAVNADDYGIVYAMEDAARSRFIYVEITFCNFFSDMDYQNEIGEEFLPQGFDAGRENPTRRAFDETGDLSR